MKREEALDVALGQIERQFGKGSVMRMSDQAQVSVGAVSTGSLSLDMALGIGGLPRGRVVEVFGPESSGKTTLVYHVIAEAQRRGGICAFIDAEHAMDPQYARRIGVNIDDLLVSQPDTGEQALEICELLVRSGAVDVVAVDSVAALTPKAEIEGEMGDSHVGLQARLMSQALRKLAGTLNRTDTICLFTNQLAGEDRRHVRLSRDDARWSRAEVLRVGASRHPPHRDAQGRRGGLRQPRARQGREEQGGAAVQAGRVRHHLRHGHPLGGHRARRRHREEGRAEVGLVLQLRRRAPRAGPAERRRLPRRAPRPRAADPRAHPARGGRGADRVRAAPAAVGGLPRRATRSRRWRTRSRRWRTRSRRWKTGLRSADRHVTAREPVVTALRASGRGRVEIELDGARWRVVPLEAVHRAGLAVGGTLGRASARALRDEMRRQQALASRSGTLRREGAHGVVARRAARAPRRRTCRAPPHRRHAHPRRPRRRRTLCARTGRAARRARLRQPPDRRRPRAARGSRTTRERGHRALSSRRRAAPRPSSPGTVSRRRPCAGSPPGASTNPPWSRSLRRWGTGRRMSGLHPTVLHTQFCCKPSLSETTKRP